MIYEQPVPVTKSHADEVFSKGSSAEIQNAIISVSLYESDRIWAEEYCLRALSDPRISIVATALTGIGHIARTKRQISVGVEEALKLLLDEPELGGRVQDALDDISIFVQR